MALEYLTFYQDRFRGGVTGGGLSLPFDNGAYSGTITVDIPATASIRRAYLFAGRQGPANPINAPLGGSPNPFNPSNQTIVPNFQQFQYGGNSSVHVRNVTNQVTPGVNNYSFSVPFQSGPNNRFSDFYLLVAFDEPSFPFINIYAFLNKLNLTLANPLVYPLSFSTPISIARPVALAMMMGDICVGGNDDIRITANSTILGDLNNSNPNTPPCATCSGFLCAGPHGDFHYYNNVLTGINGCSNNQAMGGADALSNLASIIPNNSTSFNVSVSKVNALNNTSTAVWAMFVAYMDSTDTYECQQCGDFTATNIFSTQAQLNWNVNCPLTFASLINVVQYRPVGSPTWIATTVSSITSLLITGLIPSTNYEWQVVNLDTGGAQCAPSLIQFFSTP